MFKWWRAKLRYTGLDVTRFELQISSCWRDTRK